MKKVILTIAAVAIGSAGTSIAADKPASGAELLESRCSVCHPSARPKGLKKTAAQWDATVTRMVVKGAKLSAEDKRVLVDYLAKQFK